MRGSRYLLILGAYTQGKVISDASSVDHPNMCLTNMPGIWLIGTLTYEKHLVRACLLLTRCNSRPFDMSIQRLNSYNVA